jgi:hypothetical protein
MGMMDKSAGNSRDARGESGLSGDRWFSLEDLGSGDKARVGFGAVAGGSRG